MIHLALEISFKLFCDFLGITKSEGIEWAIMDFMKAHKAELPVIATFNLLPNPKKVQRCGFKNCDHEAVASGVFLQTKQKVPLCTSHLGEAQKNPKSWKVLD